MTVETSSVIVKAVLRLGVRAGFTAGIDYSKPVEILNHTMSDLKLGSGIEASVFMNLAEFTTNVTVAKLSDRSSAEQPDDGSGKCGVSVEQGYRFAVGAAAGASVQLFDHIWGPVPKTEIPLFYTSLAGACIHPHTASAVPTATLKGRAGLSTTTTKTEYTYSALACASQLVNCPASLMSLSTNIVKTTLSTTVPSGAAVVWAAQQTGTARAVAVKFGDAAVTMASSSGKPAPYVPTSTSSASPKGAAGVINGSTGGVNNKVIIGLSVGLGAPALIAIIAAAMYVLIPFSLPRCVYANDAASVSVAASIPIVKGSRRLSLSQTVLLERALKRRPEEQLWYGPSSLSLSCKWGRHKGKRQRGKENISFWLLCFKHLKQQERHLSAPLPRPSRSGTHSLLPGSSLGFPSWSKPQQESYCIPDY